MRNERIKPDRTWLAAVTPELGELLDTVIAKRARVGGHAVAAARHSLGIPRCPKASKANEGRRERLVAMPKAELRRLIADMEPIDEAIVRERLLAERPATLAEFGVGRVAQVRLDRFQASGTDRG